MATMNRRTLLQLIASAPMAAAFTWTGEEAVQASAQVRASGAAFKPVFFTPYEYDTVKVLVDMIIPKDARSGSATEAGVPQFMDFIVNEQTNRQNAMRGGLAWLNLECHRRFDLDFVKCSDAQRREVLDDIAWPRKTVRPELAYGVPFFNSFRDLTASGFFTSKMGIDDLGYQGNTVVPEWKGCPDEVLKKLGLLPAGE
jgi:gluconate 2-dehydrogenase gamma chain